LSETPSSSRTAADRAGAAKVAHPLWGADLGTLIRALARSGGVPARSWPLLAGFFGSALGRAPFTLYERWRTRHLRRAVPTVPAPIFIVGHWRSGTTHLYNVLSKSGQFGYVPPLATGLPWDFLSLGRLMRPILEKALPDQRLIDSIPVNPDSPQEDEIALASMTVLSFYHGLYFPQRFQETFNRGIFFEDCSEREIADWTETFIYFLEKVSRLFDGKRLLIKNPAYTARVGYLRDIWPEARFIHIHRNPYDVFHSMKNFYAKLLPAFALQDYGHVDIEAAVLRAYPRMMDRLLADAAACPPNRFAEVRFESFEAAPLDTLAAVYDRLDLAGFAEAEPRFRRYVASISDYKKNEWPHPPDSVAKVREAWGRFAERWGYAPPG
jgi:hypothetical protein